MTPDTIEIDYSSSRGTRVVRNVRVADRMTARTIVLGYTAQIPRVIPNTTSDGTSSAVLEGLCTTGQASAALIFNQALDIMQSQFTLAEKRVMMPVLVWEQTVQITTIHAVGALGKGKRNVTGDFYFLDNKNNPLLIQYSVQVTGEKTSRTERIDQVEAGASQRSAMEQALATVRTYDLNGIHFDFGKATIQRDSAPLFDEMGPALRLSWRLAPGCWLMVTLSEFGPVAHLPRRHARRS